MNDKIMERIIQTSEGMGGSGKSCPCFQVLSMGNGRGQNTLQ